MLSLSRYSLASFPSFLILYLQFSCHYLIVCIPFGSISLLLYTFEYTYIFFPCFFLPLYFSISCTCHAACSCRLILLCLCGEGRVDSWGKKLGSFSLLSLLESLSSPFLYQLQRSEILGLRARLFSHSPHPISTFLTHIIHVSLHDGAIMYRE
jgi:hypothetical protein